MPQNIIAWEIAPHLPRLSYQQELENLNCFPLLYGALSPIDELQTKSPTFWTSREAMWNIMWDKSLIRVTLQ
jgi:hypothetical protein